MVRINCSEGDIVTSYFPQETVSISDEGNKIKLSGKEMLTLKEQICDATSAVIFRNGNLCIRMIYSKDTKDCLWSTIDDFIECRPNGAGHIMHDLFRVSYHDSPVIPGVCHAIGVAHINTMHGISIVGTIHWWHDTDLEEYVHETSEYYQCQLDKGNFSVIIDRLRLLLEVSKIIEECHKLGYIHTDIKPSNILIDYEKKEGKDDEDAPAYTPWKSVYIADIDSFIHSKEAGECLGTADYMSPEMMSCNLVDCETDTWAFAQLLFTVLMPEDYDDLFDYDLIDATNYSPIELLHIISSAIKTLDDIIAAGNVASKKSKKEKLFNKVVSTIAKGIKKIIVDRPRIISPIIEAIIVKIEQDTH